MFSQNWFEGLAKKNFEFLKSIIDINSPINYLEIGCFEGNCHLWMYENILKNPESKSVVIDPFEKSLTHPDSYEIFKKNLINYSYNISINKGFSDDILPTLQKDSFDIIYIDGDHSAEAAYNDGINSIDLLKSGGILIFDDYLWIGLTLPHSGWLNEHLIGGDLNPCKGINKFIEECGDKFEIIDGFSPPCQVIDIEKLYNDEEYACNYQNIFNYQMFLRKK
jgi:predicted O-methyltransferase YrrM